MLVKFETTNGAVWLNPDRVSRVGTAGHGGAVIEHDRGGMLVQESAESVVGRLNGTHNERQVVTSPLADPPQPFDAGTADAEFGFVSGSECGEFPGVAGRLRPE